MKTSRIVANAGLVFYIALMGFFIGLGCIPEVFTPKDFKAWVRAHSWFPKSLFIWSDLAKLLWENSHLVDIHQMSGGSLLSLQVAKQPL